MNDYVTDKHGASTNTAQVRGVVIRIADELVEICGTKELEELTLLKMLLKRQAWDLSRQSTKLSEVNYWLDAQPNTIEGYKNEVEHYKKRVEELTRRLEKYEPMNKLTEEEIAEGKNNKINAIKMVRARTGLGLKEAKDLVETVYPYVPVQPDDHIKF